MKPLLRQLFTEVGRPPPSPGDWPVHFVQRWLRLAPRAPRDGGYDSGFGIGVRCALYEAGAGLKVREHAAHLASWWSLPRQGEAPRLACTLSSGERLASVAGGSSRFEASCRALGVWSAPATFRRPLGGDEPDVLVLSGLPGVGKDTWLQAHWASPVISLDGLREELGVAHAAPQAPVLELAWARASRALRERQGFAWNATNCRRRQRAGLVARLQGLGAKVTLLSLEAPHALVSQRNAQRARSLSGAAWEARLEQWESVWPGEADAERWVDGAQTELP